MCRPKPHLPFKCTCASTSVCEFIRTRHHVRVSKPREDVTPKLIKDICVHSFFGSEKLFVAEILLCPPDYLGGN